jgi:hypothetical protein
MSMSSSIISHQRTMNNFCGTIVINNNPAPPAPHATSTTEATQTPVTTMEEKKVLSHKRRREEDLKDEISSSEDDDYDDDDDDEEDDEEEEDTQPLYRCGGVKNLGRPEHQTTFDKMKKDKSSKYGVGRICLTCQSAYDSDRNMHMSSEKLAKAIRKHMVSNSKRREENGRGDDNEEVKIMPLEDIVAQLSVDGRQYVVTGENDVIVASFLMRNVGG